MLERFKSRQHAAWFVWTAVALMVMGVSLGAAAQAVTDVPPSHWAYEAVRDLIDRGYLAPDDGRFNGEDSVDRFTLASVVARILHEIETGAVMPQSQADVETLRQVVNEYREDMVAAYTAIEGLSARVEQESKERAALDLHVVDLMDRLAQISKKASELEAQIAAQARLGDEQAQTARDLISTSSAENQAMLETYVRDLQSQINQLAGALDTRTQSLIGQTTTEQEALRGEVAQLAATLRQERDQRLSALESTLTGLVGEAQAAIDADRQRMDALSGELATVQQQLQALTLGAEAALEEIRSVLNAQAETLAAQQLAVEQQGAGLSQSIRALEQQDAGLSQSIRAVEQQVEALKAELAQVSSIRTRLESVERQVLAMQSQIGLSEEQLSALRDHLMTELESHYQRSFMASGNVANDLAALREEFSSYRQSTDQQLAAARQAQTIGLVGALLGLLGLMSN